MRLAILFLAAAFLAACDHGTGRVDPTPAPSRPSDPCGDGTVLAPGQNCP